MYNMYININIKRLIVENLWNFEAKSRELWNVDVIGRKLISYVMVMCKSWLWKVWFPS